VSSSPFRLYPTADVFDSLEDAIEREYRKYEQRPVSNLFFDSHVNYCYAMEHRLRLLSARVAHLEALVCPPEITDDWSEWC